MSKKTFIVLLVCDLIVMACLIYTLVYGIHNQITYGVPFGQNSIIQWLYWGCWAVVVGANPVKRLFGGYKVNGET